MATLVNQIQIRNSRTYDDSITPSELNFETNPTTLAEDVDNIISAINNLKGSGDWYDNFDNATPNRRPVAQLGTDLDGVETKTFLFRNQLLADVTVPNAQNWVVLGAGEIPTGSFDRIALVSTTEGSVAAEATTFDASNLDEVGGSNALNPKNLVIIRDANNFDAITSGGREVYALFQSESAVDGATITDTTPNRVQLSFVRSNAGGTALEAVPVADIENAVINYSHTVRLEYNNIPEQAFLSGLFADLTASSDVNLTNAIANQAGPAPQGQDIDVEVGAGLTWDFLAGTGGPSIASFENDGGTATLTLGSSGAAVTSIEGTTLDINVTAPVTIASSLVVEDGGNPDLRFGGAAGSGTIDTATGALVVNGAGGATFSATTGNVAINSVAAAVTVDAVNNVEINSTGGTLNLGNDADAFGINIGTGAAARTITVGNSTGTSALDLVTGTSEVTISSENGGADPILGLTTNGADGANVELFTGDLDPSAGGGVPAPQGSLYLRSNGSAYLKTGVADTAWSLVEAGAGTVDLQVAYEAGNAITTAVADGDVVIGGTESLQVTATGGLDVDTVADFDVTQFDVDVTGAGFSLDANGASNVTVSGADLTLSTAGGSGSLILESATGSTSVGADILVNVGSGDGAFAGGNFTLTGGAAGTTGNGGDVGLTAGEGGTVAGNGGRIDLFGGDATDGVGGVAALTGGAAGGNNAGGAAGVTGGAGAGSGDGGAVVLFAGAAGATGDGGGVQITATNGGATSGDGGQIVVNAGNGGADGAGGAITINAGDGTGTNNGGALSLSAGTAADGNGGATTLNAGNAEGTGNTGGTMFINAGTGGTTSGSGGDLFITGGDGGTTSGPAGRVDIFGGDSADSTAGNLNMGGGSSTTGSGGQTNISGGDGSTTGGQIRLTSGDGATPGYTRVRSAVSANVDETTILLTLENQGSGTGGGDSIAQFVINTDPSTGSGIAANVGSVAFRNVGGSDTDGELWLKTGSADTDWEQVDVGATGGSLQAAYEIGNTIVTDNTNGDFDVSGTEAISLDAGAASNFSVAGANLTLETTGAGNTIIQSDAFVYLGSQGVGFAGGVLLTSDGVSEVFPGTGFAGLGAGNSSSPISLRTGSVSGAGVSGPSSIGTGPANGTGSSGGMAVETGDNAGSGPSGSLTLTTGDAGTNSGSVFITTGDATDIAGDINLSAGDSSDDTTLTSGTGSINLTGGTNTIASANRRGGDITLTGGLAPLANGRGGLVDIRGGDATAGTSLGGNVTIEGGESNASTLEGASAASVFINGGQNSGDARGGDVSISGGLNNGIGGGGNVDIFGGLTTAGSGAAGNVNITAGTANDNDGANISLTATDATSTNGDGGSITFVPGAANGSGTNGLITIDSDLANLHPVFQLDNSDGASGAVSNLYVTTADPEAAISAPRGSVAFFDDSTDGRLFLKVSGTGNTGWAEVQTAASSAGREFFQTTLTSNVASGNPITDSDIVGTLPTKPGGSFTFNTDAEIYINGILQFNGTGNDVENGAGNTIDLEGASVFIGDVLTVIYYSNI